jgi:DNA-binding PadR family transcriptional regulator
MNKASEPILELLEDSGLALPPTTILVNLRREMDDAPAESTLYRAFGPLLENGYIQDVGENGTYYVITEKGRSYLYDNNN